MHRYIGALFEDDFGRLSKLTIRAAHGFAKKKLDTASQSLQLIAEKVTRKALRASDRAFRQADRAVEAEMREADQSRRKLSRRLKTALRPEKQIRHKPPSGRKRLWPYAAVALPTYDGPVRDRRGERGVFMRVRYYSRRTAGQGVSQRVVLYVFHGAEVDASGNPYAVSNAGLTIDETLCAFDHLEQVNWAAAKNAKLLLHGIFAVDYRQAPEEMMACGTRWAEETLGRFGLPYLVTLHAPPEDGDQRNWHLHVLWSFRPMERIGDHEWQVGEMLRTDLDNPEAMKLMREMFAAVMTGVSFEAGQSQVWTAKSNAARGIVEEPQDHVGASLTNRARDGEFVAVVEQNHERVHHSKVARLDEDLRHADNALANRQLVERAIAERWARLPRLPQRAPALVAEPGATERLAAVSQPIARSTLQAAARATAPIVWAEATQPVRLIEPITLLPKNGPTKATQPVIRAKVAPPRNAARPSPVKIANLRIVPVLRSFVEVPVLSHSPVRPASLASSAPLPSPATSPVRRAVSSIPSTPAIPQTARVVTVRALRPIALPLATAAIGRFDHALDRSSEALRRGEAERDDELAKAKLAERSAAEEEQRRTQAALAKLLAALRRERHWIDGKAENRIVAGSLLDRFGLDRDSLNDRETQHQLDELFHRQIGEISRIATHIRASPGDLRRVEGRWTLDLAVHPEMRALVDLWRDDVTVQGALASYAGSAPQVAHTSAPAERPSSWQGARAFREQAMSAWDDAERLDEPIVARPGIALKRPSPDRGVPALSPRRGQHRQPAVSGRGD